MRTWKMQEHRAQRPSRRCSEERTLKTPSPTVLSSFMSFLCNRGHARLVYFVFKFLSCRKGAYQMLAKASVQVFGDDGDGRIANVGGDGDSEDH